MPDGQQITWSSDAGCCAKRCPLLMHRVISEWTEERVASCCHTRVTRADVDRNVRMHRRYRFE